MSLRPRGRALLLIGGLAVSLAAAVSSDTPQPIPEVVAPVVREKPSAPPLETTSEADLAKLDLARLANRGEDRRYDNLFASRSWAPPPPPPKPAQQAAQAPPPPPTAPPLPFRYAGQLAQWSDNVHVYLMHGSETITVSSGDTIGGNYRLESVTDTSLTFTYLPLQQTQVLSIPQR